MHKIPQICPIRKCLISTFGNVPLWRIHQNPNVPLENTLYILPSGTFIFWSILQNGTLQNIDKYFIMELNEVDRDSMMGQISQFVGVYLSGLNGTCCPITSNTTWTQGSWWDTLMGHLGNRSIRISISFWFQWYPTLKCPIFIVVEVFSCQK